MGIKGLTKLIREMAPGVIKERALTNYTGCRVAVDASMLIYQYLVSVRTAGGEGYTNAMMLTNAAGEETSHLQGILTVTVRLMETGIKPIFVFDGKPPTMKGGELEKRLEGRQKALESLKEAKESGSVEDINKFSKRTVHMSSKHIMEAKILLSLMGIPVVEAPCEAEAQCAALVKRGVAFAMASEDMDSLCFHTPRLLRHFTAAKSKNLPILEFEVDRVLAGLGLTSPEFIDLCILSGCDYCDTIRGIGPKKALKFIHEHHSIEGVLEHLDREKYTIPDEWPFAGARELFVNPDVDEAVDCSPSWLNPNQEGMIEFLCKDKGFDEERVKRIIDRLVKSRGKASQKRVDSFFGRDGTSTAVKRPAPVSPAAHKSGAKKPRRR